MKYPENIMKYLRQREGIEPDDLSLDRELQSLPRDEAFKEVLYWKGLIGSWNQDIKGWIKDIYGIDLDNINDYL